MISMADSEWTERKEKHLKSETQKLPAKKKDYRSGKNILRICTETLLMSLINLSNNYQLHSKIRQFTDEKINAELKKKQQ